MCVSRLGKLGKGRVGGWRGGIRFKGWVGRPVIPVRQSGASRGFRGGQPKGGGDRACVGWLGNAAAALGGAWGLGQAAEKEKKERRGRVGSFDAVVVD